MTVSAHTHNAPLDPPDTSAQDEREAREIDEARAVLFSLRTFRDEAWIGPNSEDLHRARHLALDDGDSLEADRLERRIWDEHADFLINARAQGYQRITEARRLVREFRDQERQQFPERVRSTTFPARTGVSTEATGTPAAGSLSSDLRSAA